MKKIILILISYFYILVTSASLKDDMLPNNKTLGVSGDGTGALNSVFIYTKNFLFAILWIIVVGVFLYFGFKLISARGNPEEFKKTLIGFVYAIVGLAIIPMAFGIVKLVASLKF